MRTRELKRWIGEAAKLTPCQREQVLARLQAGVEQDAVDAALRSRAPPVACPACQCPRIVRNGQAGGVQRFKCRGCGTTFNTLTGTPLARLRHRAKWLQQAEALEAGLSVRKAAARMGVHRTTAFRWRHRFLAVPREAKATHLAGVVEADEAYVLRSFKGQPRRLRDVGSRRPRRRGGHAAKRGLSQEQVPVLVVRNRSGHTTDFVLACANKRGLAAVLPTALAVDAVLCTDGSSLLGQRRPRPGPGTPRLEHAARRTNARRLAHPERQRLPQPLQGLDGALQGRGHVLPAELSGLVPRTGPERAIRRQSRVTAGSGHFGMKPSSANANRAFRNVSPA